MTPASTCQGKTPLLSFIAACTIKLCQQCPSTHVLPGFSPASLGAQSAGSLPVPRLPVPRLHHPGNPLLQQLLPQQLYCTAEVRSSSLYQRLHGPMLF